MKRLSLFLSSAVFGLIAIKGVAVPPRFCEGVRSVDGVRYETFIQNHALTEGESANLSDPVIREMVRRSSADRWGRQVRNGQIALCGKASF